MWDWLLSPIDPNRAHEVGTAIAWHARVMVLAWGVLAPLAVIVARFFKVVPGQDWPRTLDTPFWWRSHWQGHSLVVVFSVIGLLLVLPSDLAQMSLHNWLGFGVLAGLVFQVALGVFRGSKGGPTAPAKDGSWRGDHYDMTPWRRGFEVLHKSVGYCLLMLAVVVIVLGLWKANAPNWMWGAIGIWWLALAFAFIRLQSRGLAVDTYQAIWGDDPKHPGNRLPLPGWGVRRLGYGQEEQDVRHDRRDRVRGH